MLAHAEGWRIAPLRGMLACLWACKQGSYRCSEGRRAGAKNGLSGGIHRVNVYFGEVSQELEGCQVTRMQHTRPAQPSETTKVSAAKSGVESQAKVRMKTLQPFPDLAHRFTLNPKPLNL